MDGKVIKNYSPLDSITRGVALCPEDRKAQGIVGGLTRRGEHHPGDAGQPGLVQISEHEKTV